MLTEPTSRDCLFGRILGTLSTLQAAGLLEISQLVLIQLSEAFLTDCIPVDMQRGSFTKSPPTVGQRLPSLLLTKSNIGNPCKVERAPFFWRNFRFYFY